ncbi:phosphoglycerate kinase [Marimonas arenosa]|uniref:Phosphoglycerate kinase n=1 Tax=Marimonas arenosa TaxID=1795305 RepID=A0AAE3WBJ0_9RHOB|nr:phosphoglycerate kinase [Marimonas arenosa]MDQ2089609.1 phosphoglycerate kinase [Marimonas arenosa]
MTVPAISEMNVAGKRLLVRADLNVPMSEGRVTDATRITRFAEGMKPLLAKGARLVILTHFGRPKGQVMPEMSVDALRPTLAEALGVDVAFCSTSSGPEAERAASALKDGEAVLMENVRFDSREEANDSGLGALFARLGDIYVNDAFSTAHRAHASTEAVAHLMPAAAGPLMMEEITALQNALEAPQSPAIAIVGGAKVSTKIAVLKNLVKKLDGVIIGGGMANTFLFADGAPMGASLHEPDQVATVEEIRRLAAENDCTLHLPADVACGAEFKAGAAMSLVPADKCPSDQMILDAGPQAVASFKAALETAKTILWNGPLGAFEIPPFDKATTELAKKAAELTRNGKAVSVAGGGDTVSALIHAGVKDDFTYVSSAGGAFLEWLEGKTLPGIAALMRSEIAA